MDAESATESAEPDSSTVIISGALANFLGTEAREIRQSEAMKIVLEYIKVNQLEVSSQVYIFVPSSALLL